MIMKPFWEVGIHVAKITSLDDDSCGRLLKNAHLQCFPHPSSLQRTYKYASLLGISGALHLDVFQQPGKDDFFTECYSSASSPKEVPMERADFIKG